MNRIFCILAATGFILGCIVHIVSLCGIYLGERFPFIWGLHFGIFIVWLPAILELGKNPELKELNSQKVANPLIFFRVIFRNVPKPVMIISVFFFLYAMVNFWLFIYTDQGATPDIVGEKYVLLNHGTLIRELTKQEYLELKANAIRGFSGHWMAFYGFAMGILWPKK